MKKEVKLGILAWIFVILGISSVFGHVFFGRWQYAVWFCNHAMVIAGLAVFFRSRFWLTAMLNWALVPVSLWVIDFLSKLLFGSYVFRITEYMFVDPWWGHLLSLQHLLTIPLMLYALWLIGRPHRFAFMGTAVHGLVLWIISYAVITPDYNINCVHYACPGVVPEIPCYALLWPLVSLLMFILTNIFLLWIFRKRAQKARH